MTCKSSKLTLNIDTISTRMGSTIICTMLFKCWFLVRISNFVKIKLLYDIRGEIYLNTSVLSISNYGTIVDLKLLKAKLILIIFVQKSLNMATIDIDELIRLEKEHYSPNSARLPISKHIKNYTEMSEEDEKMFKTFGLSKEEAYIYLVFTGHCSTGFNRSLSHLSQTLNPLEKIVIEAFDEILKKLEGSDDKKVYRMDDEYDPEAVKKWFIKHKGEAIEIPWFLSTSTEEWEGRSVVWEITLLPKDETLARSVYEILNHGDENEVRFQRGARFIVDGFRESDETLYIQLTETRQPVKSDAILSYSKY